MLDVFVPIVILDIIFLTLINSVWEWVVLYLYVLCISVCPCLGFIRNRDADEL